MGHPVILLAACGTLCDDPVAVAWGLAGYQHSYWFEASIDCLMLLAGGDLESFAGLKNKVVMFYFESQLSFENEEELACVDVGVAGFAGAGRHKLFDDAQCWGTDEVPTVAVGCLRASPLVVFGGFCADDLYWQLSST
jgi:hypothetical protein